MFRHTIATMVLGATVSASAVFAQQAVQPAQPVQPGQQVRPGTQVQVNPNAQAAGAHAAMRPMADQHTLAACLAIANQEEVALAEIASDKSKNKDVKEFAKMVIDDHQAFLKKLQQFAPEARETSLNHQASTNQSRVQTAGGVAQAQASQQPARTQQGQPIQQVAGQAEQRSSGSVDVIQLHREIAQQCLADAKKKMSDEGDDKFDACFIGHQIAKHEAMKTTLTVFQRHSSGEFAQLLADGIKTTDKHLKDAEKIMDDLADHHRDSKNDRSDKKDNSEKSSKSDK